MDKFFFSEKNVARQFATLEQLINMSDNPDSKRHFKKFLVKEMKEVYDKYGKKKPPTMKPAEFIDLLNKKSIKECVRICEEKKATKKKNYSQDQLGEIERSREEEMYGQRDIQVPRRPQHMSLDRQNNSNRGQQNNRQPGFNNGMDGFSDGGGGGFAPIPKGNGEFITASGEMGAKMFFGNLEDQMYGSRGDAKNELERRMLERMNEYDQRKGGMMGGNMMGGNMMGDGMGSYDPLSGSMNPNMPMYGNNDFMNPMMRMGNPGPGQGGQVPQINFTLVEGKNKGRNDSAQYNPNQNMNMGMFPGMGQMDNLSPFGMDMGMMSNMNMGMMPNMNMGMMPNMNGGMMQNPNNMMQNPNNMMQNHGGMNMGMPQMNDMHQNLPNFGNHTSPNMSDAEIQSKYNSMLAERDNLDAHKMKIMGGNKNFNPMMSPNMMPNMQNMQNMDVNQLIMMQKMQEMMTNGNNHLNYNRGVHNTIEFDGMKNLDSEQLDTYIKKMKDTIYHQMNLTNFDPLFLQTMDAKQLDQLIKKISLELSGLNDILVENTKSINNISNTNNVNEYNNVANNNTNSYTSQPTPSVNNSNNTKSNYTQHQISTNEFRESFQQSNINHAVNLSNNSMVDTANIPFKLNNIIITDDTDNNIVLDVNNIISNNNKDNSRNAPYQQNNNILNNHNQHNINQNVKVHDILIKSVDYDEPENYNDYLVQFENDYKNVTSFKILNLKVPKISHVVHNENHLTYTIDDSENIIKVKGGNYKSTTLIETINKQSKDGIFLELNDNKVLIKNTNNKSFDITNNEKSLLRYLGFTKLNYIGKKQYIAENIPLIDEDTKIYMFIEGIVDEKPIAIIDTNTDLQRLCPINIDFDKPLESLPEIFIKFKKNDNPDVDELIDFNGEPNEMLIRISTL
ncbi:metallo-peptidase family M12 [Fadolivirus algeromassiliense]|jgi:hypothetical protein|uniref:Metallo-peptidase family M12 n=1 Tax=Fadolivirus FV1/VV64 TaxID=3070911 RepID=A0A7D3V8N2_9VIRU|nr:metallo-peptidase family M12 [Fadolivirus algeromassiliense]QKF93797.1 metallo-peptidase family M12 [Fadolivirus FV1/VV64]